MMNSSEKQACQTIMAAYFPCYDEKKYLPSFFLWGMFINLTRSVSMNRLMNLVLKGSVFVLNNSQLVWAIALSFHHKFKGTETSFLCHHDNRGLFYARSLLR